jgi:hypothetical protein
MSSVKPDLEDFPADRVRSPFGRLPADTYSTPTSPKIHELKTRYKATHANESDCKNCRMSMAGYTSLVECLMEGMTCQWVMHFGNARFCNHPSARQFVKSSQP